MKGVITFKDFAKIDLRIGTILEIIDFLEARHPAYQFFIDFGALGIKKNIGLNHDTLSKKDLINKQVVAVVNFLKKTNSKFYERIFNFRRC